MRARAGIALGLLLCAGSSGFAWADDSSATPSQWLARMSRALTDSNYDGVFMHVRGGSVETLRIIHRVQDGTVDERLVSLDGSGREFIRRGNEMACYMPDSRTVVVEEQPADARPLLGNLPRFDDTTANVYDIRAVGRARLLGRDTQLISVRPKDRFRYGYRLWIDESSNLPLRTQLCDASGAVIEQIVFANLTLPERIADEQFRPQVAAADFNWLRRGSRQVQAATSAASWGGVKLPPGFRVAARTSQVMPGSEKQVDQVVFTDGLASISVFVEQQGAPARAGESEERETAVGSVSVFSTVSGGQRYTAVGEAPIETVRYIATSVKSGAPDFGRRKR
ncbi:MAG: MucB/RseB C-terminal domain-containing protein [Steroidobacteraceae bacterium]